MKTTGSEQARYAVQAKAKWGNTDAYLEYERRAETQTAQQQNEAGAGLIELFRAFGRIRDRSPKDDEAQALVKALQNYITEHFYTCTDAILSGLGGIYACGGEFTKNIDAQAGKGTAEFAAAAIAEYVK